jgi:hypothetical protein
VLPPSHDPNIAPASFGTSYSVSCGVGVAGLLAGADYSSTGPRFYDPFLVQDDGSLYPVPVKVVNRAGGNQVGGAQGADGAGLAWIVVERRGARLASFIRLRFGLRATSCSGKGFHPARGQAAADAPCPSPHHRPSLALSCPSRPLLFRKAGAHVRRFFFIDGTLATPLGAAPKAIVYPSSLNLEFTIQADQRDHLLPPVLTIT